VGLIQLVKPSCHEGKILSDKWYTPLNLIWIATYLKTAGFETQIIDGIHLNLGEIINKISAPLVGICFNVLSVDSMEKISHVAKNRGSKVVVGGQAATPLAKQLLTKNRNIDVVVLGDGEEAMLQLARRVDQGITSLEGIPNIAYRERDRIVFSDSRQMDLTTLPFPDRKIDGIDMEKYIGSFYETNTDPALDNVRVTNAYMKKGCPRRVRNRGCSFCARIDRGLRSKSALQAYEEYNYLIKEFDINYIYDDSDSWVQGPWMRSLLNIYNKFGKLKSKFRIYADVRDINENSVVMMKDLGIDTVLVGIESGDEWILRFNGKPMTKEMIFKAAKLLGAAEIKLCDAYVLGLIGETKESLKKTITLAQQISNYCEKRITYWNVIMPLPGSPIWNEMMRVPKLSEKYSSEYKFNLEEVQTDYIDHFCHLGSDGYSYLMNICNYLQSLQNIPLRKYVR
jgi:anaerobic magnesium-protoporphyrin IX monomethyl ester cyclase